MATPYDAWIGREERVVAALDPWPAQALRAALALEPAEVAPLAELPPLWSWLYALETPRGDATGADGHAARGGFTPPVPARRRMFAGGQLEFAAPLRLGEAAEQVRRVAAVAQKAGAAGPLTFLTLDLETRQAGGGRVRERRDIVYLDPPPPAPAPPPAPVPDAPWRLDLTPDPVLLMRFSALTYNGHRIHYDLPYAQAEEGYPERVVHGPLIALLLAELARLQGGVRLTRFAFRARAPTFAGRPLHLRGTPTDAHAALAAYDDAGRLAVSAEVEWA